MSAYASAMSRKKPGRSERKPTSASSTIVFVPISYVAFRIALVDDAVSSGSTLISVHKLLSRLDCEIAAVVVAMRQGTAWRDNVADAYARLPGLVRGAIAAPLFEFGGDGWYPIAGTLDEDG